MRIVCVLQTLRAGGAQRVFSLMAEEWIAQGHEVSLLLFTDDSEPDFTPVNPNVTIRRLGILGASGGSLLQRVIKNLRRFPVMRKAVADENPDCVVGLMIDENLVLRLSTLGMRVPVILVEHSPYSYDPGYLKRMLRDFVYPLADGVVVLTRQAKQHAVGCVRERTVVIENPVNSPSSIVEQGLERQTHKSTKQGGVFIAIGRLAAQKRFDRLVRAFSLIADRCKGWQVFLYGSGDQEGSLGNLIGELGLQERVILKGPVKEPWEALSEADVFVMSSDTEGFPMALIEAMACGLAVVSTDCPTGPGELIIHGSNGLLVPMDEQALADAMLRLAVDADLRAKLGSEAMNVRERLGVERIMGRYNRFLANCIHSNEDTARV